VLFCGVRSTRSARRRAADQKTHQTVTTSRPVTTKRLLAHWERDEWFDRLPQNGLYFEAKRA
jgi:hypothetical protein